MTDFDAIRARKSRRNYLETEIEREKADALREQIARLNGISGLGMAFLEDGSAAFDSMEKTYGMFRNVRSLIMLKGPATDPHLKEKCGYYGERLVLEATKLGLGTCWVGGTYDRENPVFQLDSGEVLISVITVGNVAPEETGAEKEIRDTVRRKTKTKEEMYQSDVEAPEWFLDAMERVQRAPSAVNSQKSRFILSGSEITAEIANDALPDLIDLGIAKLHFELGTDGTFELGNPGLFQRKDKVQ